jgi:hypothetical protein
MRTLRTQDSQAMAAKLQADIHRAGLSENIMATLIVISTVVQIHVTSNANL